MSTLGGVVGGLNTGDFTQIIYQSETPINAADVRINFLNDQTDPITGVDYNLAIDNLKIGGVTYQTEAPTTYSTGTFVPGVGIVAGFQESEILSANGYFQYLFGSTGNTDPVAVADDFTTAFDTAVSGNLLTNDSDSDPDDVISVESNTEPDNGTVTVTANGDFTYTPNAGFFGTDSFDYTITDIIGATATATATITVNEVSDNTQVTILAAGQTGNEIITLEISGTL